MKPLGTASIAVAAAVLLAACSVVEATPDRVVVRFNTFHPDLAIQEATQHCAQFGKRPVLVRSDAVSPSLSTFFTSTSESTFDCVVPPTPEVKAPDVEAPDVN